MKKSSRLSLATTVALAGLFGVGGAAGQVSAQSDNGASDICPPLSTGKIDTPNPDPATVSYTAPDGKVIVQYCVKAGTTTEFMDFDAKDKMTSVVIDHSKDSVSHWSVRYVDLPEDPDPEQPDPEDPDPEQPDPEDPDPEQPDPEQPDPEQPDPEDPDPEQPDPEDPDPEQPDPEDPDPEQPDPEQPDPEEPDLTIDGPASAPEEGDVDSAGPLPPAQTPDPTPAPPVAAPAPASLPATGSSSWALAGSALAALLAGLGLVRFSRRPDGSSTV